MTKRKRFGHRKSQLMQKYIVEHGEPDRAQLRRFNELYDKAEASNFDPCPPANDVEGERKRREYYKVRERYKTRAYTTNRKHWSLVTRTRTVLKYRMVGSSPEDRAPYAYLLDYVGARPIAEFGWLCIGDTPEVTRKK